MTKRDAFSGNSHIAVEKKSMEENEEFSLELGSYDSLDKKVTFE